MKCANCGVEIVEHQRYCWKCGHERALDAELPPELRSQVKKKIPIIWPIAVFLFVLFGIPSCLGGTCFLLLATGGSGGFFGNQSLWTSVGFFAVFGGFLYLYLWARRKSKL